ncbi:uncharacterized protein [Clytia hemisphaerica]|uniref:Uncharacterized protein n=1 Tax=Clytia hemisphaerica TaxID=252671 RepID=A0A7M5VC53_9CNID
MNILTILFPLTLLVVVCVATEGNRDEIEDNSIEENYNDQTLNDMQKFISQETSKRSFSCPPVEVCQPKVHRKCKRTGRTSFFCRFFKECRKCNLEVISEGRCKVSTCRNYGKPTTRCPVYFQKCTSGYGCLDGKFGGMKCGTVARCQQCPGILQDGKCISQKTRCPTVTRLVGKKTVLSV